MEKEKEPHLLQSVVNTALSGRKTLKILDAGYKPYLSLPENAYVVGIDISEEQLRKNTSALVLKFSISLAAMQRFATRMVCR